MEGHPKWIRILQNHGHPKIGNTFYFCSFWREIWTFQGQLFHPVNIKRMLTKHVLFQVYLWSSNDLPKKKTLSHSASLKQSVSAYPSNKIPLGWGWVTDVTTLNNLKLLLAHISDLYLPFLRGEASQPICSDIKTRHLLYFLIYPLWPERKDT